MSSDPHVASPMKPNGSPIAVNTQAFPDAKAHSGSEAWSKSVLFNLVVPLLLLGLGGLAIVVFGEAKAKPLPPPDLSLAGRMQALPAARVEVVRSLESTGKKLELVVDGSVVPYQEALVAAEVAGRVVHKEPICEAGSVVKQGQLLMRIDPTDYELAVERLTRQKEQEYRALQEVDQEIANIGQSIKIADQDVKLQQNEVERQLSLPKNFASQAEIDRAKGALLQASQQLLNLNNQIRLLRARRTKLESSEELAATQLRAAETDLKRTEIVAPISGVIVSEQADLNTFVNRGTTLVTIEDTSKVEVSSRLRMDQLHWVLDQNDPNLATDGYDLPDTPAIIEFDVAGRESSTYRWRGKLVSYDGVGLDTATRTVPVRVLVDSPNQMLDAEGAEYTSGRSNALVRGMFVRIRLQIQPKTPLVVIPAQALRPGNRVWVFTEDASVLDEIAPPQGDETQETGADPKEVAVVPAKLAGKKTEPLDAEQKAATQKNDPEDKALNAVDSEASAEPTLDPKNWIAGKVTVSQTVYPVESLRLSDTVEDDPLVSPVVKSAGRMWVCEAAGDEIVDGTRIVVSPLGSVGADGVAVRIPNPEASIDNEPEPQSEPQAEPVPATQAVTQASSATRAGESR
ncbi:efflux RND transporter periplasmic adaptor subunit [Stieleria varia]|nr:HlyD family efflux transporter periplasmic adaptor subunit [Stieleria varia]